LGTRGEWKLGNEGGGGARRRKGWEFGGEGEREPGVLGGMRAGERREEWDLETGGEMPL